CLTAADVLLILALQNKGFRYIEALVIALVGTVGICFAIEVWLSRPEFAGIAHGLFVPALALARDRDMLYIAVGILGATVMPHNLYLHSSIVQTRRFALSGAGKREA